MDSSSSQTVINQKGAPCSAQQEEDAYPSGLSLTTACEMSGMNATMTGTPISNTLSQRNRRSVSFYPSVRIMEVLHVNDYADDEVEACWYTPQEVQDRKERLLQLSHDDVAINNVDPDYEQRGLEDIYSPLLVIERKWQVQLEAMYTVLNEQMFQKQTYGGIKNHETIAQMYSAVADERRIAAYLLGLSDARVAHIIMQEEEDHRRIQQFLCSFRRTATGHLSPQVAPLINANFSGTESHCSEPSKLCTNLTTCNREDILGSECSKGRDRRRILPVMPPQLFSMAA